MLYEIGELNDHLLPVGNEVQDVEEKILFPLWENEEENALHKPGSKKCRKIYDKQVIIIFNLNNKIVKMVTISLA